MPRTLQLAGLLLAVVALARPVIRSPLPLQTQGIDVVLCVDVSSSMGAKDLAADRSRLDVARAAALDFVAARSHDRIGAIRFARYPDLCCPLTLDHDALAGLIAEIEPVERESPEDATGIGTAVARAAEVLKQSDARSKVVILLTDGEENVATDQTPEEIAPLHASQLCRDLGIRVHALVVGKSDADARQVRALAERTGGRYFSARDADTVAAVYDAIDAREKTHFAEPRFEVEERFTPFLLAALGLILASRLLASTWLEVSP